MKASNSSCEFSSSCTHVASVMSCNHQHQQHHHPIQSIEAFEFNDRMSWSTHPVSRGTCVVWVRTDSTCLGGMALRRSVSPCQVHFTTIRAFHRHTPRTPFPRMLPRGRQHLKCVYTLGTHTRSSLRLYDAEACLTTNEPIAGIMVAERISSKYQMKCYLRLWRCCSLPLALSDSAVRCE